MRLVAVMVGGAVGTLARWAVDLAVPSVGGFALATFLINVTVALVFGLAGVLLLERLPNPLPAGPGAADRVEAGSGWPGRAECRPPAGRPLAGTERR